MVALRVVVPADRVQIPRLTFGEQMKEDTREYRIIFAARSYTEYRRPDGSVYVEHHKPQPKRKERRR